MGRTPLLNAQGGKDHWPWTTALLIGSGVTGGRVIGGFNEFFNGHRVDFSSGDLSESGEYIRIDNFAATLARLADVDPSEMDLDAAPLEALLS